MFIIDDIFIIEAINLFPHTNESTAVKSEVDWMS